MAKAEWGVKRVCQACGVRFYDLQKTPVICPKCQAPYEIISHTKGKRGKGTMLEDSRAAIVDDLALHDGLVLPDELEEGVSDSLIEDAEDLDASLEEVSDVLDHDHKGDH